MRNSGILMHITSLPGAYGVGTMGKEAYRFVDFLEEAGQSYWQILPLTPTGYGDSPYQSCSTFAGNHYLIDLDQLIEQGLLEKQEVESCHWSVTEQRVDFGLLYQSRLSVLRKAFDRFEETEEFRSFCRKQKAWLPDFALFMALKQKFEGMPWYQWEDAIKFRKPAALKKYRAELKDEMNFYCFLQYLFYSQWEALRDYAHGKGIKIIGDVPIYVPYDSVEVWTDPAMFLLDQDLNPEAVAGCPPDYFSEDGQLWGNPLYRWDVHKEQNFAWWVQRMAAAGERYDVVRLDHFRGFEAYWAVPFGDKTARGGQWLKGPDMDFVNAMKTQLPRVAMIAEDLGMMTQEVYDLRDASGYPGMKVLGFAFDSEEPCEHLPHMYIPNTVCYTGTHDNMTSRQWLDTASEKAVRYAAEYMNLTPQEGYVWGMIRTAMASVSDLCVIPMQDYLELGEEGRMNLPGSQTDKNWTWRAKSDYLYPGLAQRIHRLTKIYGRLTEKEETGEEE